jgi:hypothetical protein
MIIEDISVSAGTRIYFSGGFGRKVSKEGKSKRDERKIAGEGATLDDLDAVTLPPKLPHKAPENTAAASAEVKKVEKWVQHLDTKSGYEYGGNVVTCALDSSVLRILHME